jgi:hypothetical protein
VEQVELEECQVECQEECQEECLVDLILLCLQTWQVEWEVWEVWAVVHHRLEEHQEAQDQAHHHQDLRLKRLTER